MKRYATATVIAALLLLTTATSSVAGKGWCRSDPIIVLAGVQHSVEVAVHFPEDGTGYATGPTTFRVGTPLDVVVIQVDPGFDGYGERVLVNHRTYERFTVAVPTDRPYELAVYVDGALAAVGTTADPVPFDL